MSWHVRPYFAGRGGEAESFDWDRASRRGSASIGPCEVHAAARPEEKKFVQASYNLLGDAKSDSDSQTRTVFENEILPLLPLFWVRVHLPGDQGGSVVVNPTHLIPQNGSVADLKKAVLKELAVELQGKGISHLTVYPPGKKKDGEALDVGDALKSASRAQPYHVEVK